MTKTIAFDTECIGFAWHGDELAFLATTADAEREWVYNLRDKAQAEAFTEQLADADELVGHNSKFDVHQVRATLDFDVLDLGVPIYDTEIMARVFWPEGKWKEHGGFGLKPLAKVFIDPDADVEEDGLKQAAKDIGYRSLKSQTGVYYEVWRAYPEILEAYALKDARYTYDLFKLLTDEYHNKATDGQRHICDLEHGCLPIFIRAEEYGTAVNPEKVKALHATFKHREREMKRKLLDVHCMPENALGGEGSEAALPEWLLKQGVPLTERTDSGDAFSTSKFALQKFTDDYPVIDDFLEFRTIEKFLGTYIEPMLDRNVVHPNFRPIGAWTGRSSCAEPNMQNIPVRSGNEVREVFEARPGHKLVCCDYDSIEMRILAYYLGREGQPYRDLINSGHDPHAHMASLLWSGDPADYAKGTPGEDQRAVAKSGLFAIVYGAGGRRLCDMFNLNTGPALKAGDWEVRKGIANEGDPSYAEGKALARKIKQFIPGYALLNKRIRQKVEDVGYVTTILGRKQKVAAEKSYVGMSALIQGSAADVMKEGLVRINEALGAEYERGHILLVVHDEVVVETPVQHADSTLAVVTEAMEDACDILDPPLVVSGSINDNYGEGH